MSDDAGRKQEITEESNDKDSKFVDEDGASGGGSKEVSRTTHRIFRSAHCQAQRRGSYLVVLKKNLWIKLFVDNVDNEN